MGIGITMNKGLDLIQRQQIETIDGYPTGNVYIGLTSEELAELEKELKELENYKKAEEKLIGIDEELKTLESIKKWINDNRKFKGFPAQLDNEFRIIELALKDYGYLQVSFNRWVDKCLELEKSQKYERELNDGSIAKKLKALEIIKREKVNIHEMAILFKSDTTYEDYEKLWTMNINEHITYKSRILYSLFMLTKEEFDILKDVLS